jgi:hypothetical protein
MLKKIFNLFISLSLGFLFISCASAKTDKMQNKDEYIKGELVIGFQKNILAPDAENVLRKHKVEFIKTNNVNAGRMFFEETGAKFIVKVPAGKELDYVKIFKKEKSIKYIAPHIDPNKLIVD